MNLLHCSMWSSFYYSAPVEYKSEHEFCNCVAITESDLEPVAFLHLTQEIECRLGRTRKSEGERHFDREIDIDILMAFDSTSSFPHSINSSLHFRFSELTIPHPKMKERAFVMTPLQEILQKNT